MLDICIIGGGASGMVAAITAARKNAGLKIAILEKKETLGKKLLATGNGKCNMSNTACTNAQKALGFFSSIGVITRVDDAGRIYPYTEQAKEVVYSLARQIEALDISVETNAEVTSISRESGPFTIRYQHGEIKARQLLIAAGGKAGPQYGTTGDSYRFAKTFGHTVGRIAPSLAAVETQRNMGRLKGIRSKGRVCLKLNQEEIAEEIGEIQFTDDGLSGICIFNLSRFIRLDENTSFNDYSVAVDFLPSMNHNEVTGLLTERTELAKLKCNDLLMSIVAAPIAEHLLTSCAIDPNGPAKAIKHNKITKLAHLLKDWDLPLSGVKGWKSAQCTAGGVSLEDIDLDTMESKIINGLYFSGEVIDFDGPCGGFNLQNAWETGIKAGESMANV